MWVAEPGAARRERLGGAEPERARTALDWVNLVTRDVGPVRALPTAALADSLGKTPILVVPGAAVEDRAVARCAAALLRSGGVVVVDIAALAAARGPKSAEKARAVWGRPAERLVLLTEPLDDAAVLARIAAARPFPRLAHEPAGWTAMHVPALVGPSATLAAAAEKGAERGVPVTAFIDRPQADVEELERVRAAGAALGVALVAEGEGASPESVWAAGEERRRALRRLGASSDEIATLGLFATRPETDASRAAIAAIAAIIAERAATDSVRILAVPRSDEDGAGAPFQPRVAGGAPAPFLAVPADPSRVASPEDTAWLAAADAARGAGAWVTRLDAYRRFWEERARTPLASTWDGTRLGIVAKPPIEGVALLIPAAAGGRTLKEILWKGGSARGETVETPAGPCIRLRLDSGENSAWAVYR